LAPTHRRTPRSQRTPLSQRAPLLRQADSGALHTLLRDLLAVAVALAGSEGEGEDGVHAAGEAKGGDARRQRAEQLAPSLGKCRQLSAALVGSFQDIRTRHADGDLALLAPRELLALLHALFDAAALRSAAGRDFVSLLEA
jgi:hypothetical protein